MGKRVLRYTEYTRMIDNGNIANCHLLFGEEDFLIEECVSKLLDKVINKEAREFDLSIIDGSKASIKKIISAGTTLPLIGDTRVLVIKSFDKVRAGEGDELLRFFKNIPKGTYVFCVATSKPDMRLKINKAISDIGTLVKLDRLYSEEAARWIVDRVRGYGGEISKDASMLLVSTSGNHLRRLDTEITKILTFIGEEKRQITKEDIKNLITPLAEHTIFEIGDAIAVRNQRLALQRLEEVLAGGEPIVLIVYMLVRQVRLLFRTKLLTEMKINRPDKVRKELGINSIYETRKLLNQSKNYTTKELERAIDRFKKVDAVVKTSGGSDARLEVELAIIELCENS